jgi:hypothetical protein
LRLFFDDELENLIVRETNRYAETYIQNCTLIKNELERCDKRGNIFGSRTDNVHGNNSETHCKNLFHQESFCSNFHFPSNYVPEQV